MMRYCYAQARQGRMPRVRDGCRQTASPDDLADQKDAGLHEADARGATISGSVPGQAWGRLLVNVAFPRVSRKFFVLSEPKFTALWYRQLWVMVDA